MSRRTVIGAFAALGVSLVVGASGAAAADFTLRVHTLVQSPHPYNDMAAAFREEVEARSEGRIAVRIFDSGQLGQDPAVISEIGLGTIDMIISTTSNAVQQVPELAIFTMPYLFASMEELAETVGPGTPVHDHFVQVFQDRGIGMRLLALGGSGTRNMATAAVPVTGVGDLAGLTMRTPPSPMDAETWAALGMLPVTVAWGELYAAMQTGVAQAMESSLPGYTGSKLFEVAPNLALTAHTIQVNHTSISERTWNRLPADLQEIVAEAALNANLHGIEMSIRYDSELVEMLQAEHGVNVTRPDTAEFRAMLEPIQADLAQRLGLDAEFALLMGPAN